MKYTLLTLCFILAILFSQAQELYMPKEIKKAYTEGYRSNTGLPGKHYFVNKSKYNINVSFDPLTAKLKGWEEITYFNNSNDTLQSLLIKLYQNLYMKGAVRYTTIDSNDVTDGVRVKIIKLNQKPYAESLKARGTNMTVKLPSALLPKDSIKIELSWELHIPKKTTIRMGKYDETSYFIGYWYPQIAVYDDISGWYFQTYNGQHELFNEYADYRVSIDVPKNYIVWATGVLQNPEEVLNDNILKKYKQALESDEAIPVISEDDLKSRNLTKGTSWRYKANYVNDFSFALSDHYLWDATSIISEEGSNSRIIINSAYKANSTNFKHVAAITHKLMQEFPNFIGRSYPYPSMSIFNGGGAMEYPMMVNQGEEPDYKGAMFTTSHEVVHSFFPFYVGNNQEKHAWLDEGITTMIPMEFQKATAPDWQGHVDFAKTFSKMANSDSEVPSMIPSINVDSKGYFVHAYIRPAEALYFLKDMLGEDLFLKCMKDYIQNWNGKHPTPYDFFNTFNRVGQQNLNWYWQKWFFDKGVPDLAIDKVDKDSVYIRNVGIFPLPIRLNIVYKDGSKEEIKENASVWKNQTVTSFPLKGSINSIKLGDETIPDSYPSNNIVELIK